MNGSTRLALYAPFLLPAATAVLLALPRLRFAYLFDDYDFLARTQLFHLGLLTPDPALVFYRPISREIYFGFLNWLSPGNPLTGHVLNAILLAGAVFLGATLAGRLAGRKAGLIAGLLLAAFSQWPILVAWVSGAQDLLSIDFTLLALHFELSGRGAKSLVAFACAILSKETAVAAAPALVAIHWLRFPSVGRALPGSIRLGALLGVWALIHPGVRIMLERGDASLQGMYIGLENPNRWTSLLTSIPVFLNFPLKLPTAWPQELTWALGLAVVPFLAAFWALHRPGAGLGAQMASGEILGTRASVGFGALLALPPLLLTCLLVQFWVPYYASFPAVGVSIALGCWLATLPYRFSILCLALYLVLGVWSRGVELKLGMTTEQGLAPAGVALPVVERNFKKLARSLPRSSVVYVTTMATGPQSVYRHLHAFQALRVWYRDPTLQTLRPELRVISGEQEFLFAVDPKLNVFQIDVKSLAVRSTGGRVEHSRYRSVLISFAVGLAGVGEIDRAVTILMGVDEPGTPNGDVNRRIAAMLLLSRGETAAAAHLLRHLPDLQAGEALENVGILLTVPTRGTPLEEHALKAFGLSPRDPRAIRPLLVGLLSLGHYEVSKRLAVRLLALRPGDPEATAALARIDSLPVPLDQVTQPTRKLEFPR